MFFDKHASNILQFFQNTYWATLFKIHTPPVEDFGKVYHKESVNFQMHLPSVWFLGKAYHRGSKYFIWKWQMSSSTWNSHSPCVRCSWIFHRGCVESKWSCPVGWGRQNKASVKFDCFTVYLGQGQMKRKMLSDIILVVHYNQFPRIGWEPIRPAEDDAVCIENKRWDFLFCPSSMVT